MNLKKLTFISIIIFFVFLLCGCFTKKNENRRVEISEIKVFDDKENELNLEVYNDYEIFFFDNEVENNNFEKLTQPTLVPRTYYYATKFKDEKSFKFVIYGECFPGVTLKDIELVKSNNEGKYQKVEYLDKNIKVVDSKFEVNILINAPTISTGYVLDNILLNINGVTNNGYTVSQDINNEQYYGVYLKDIKNINDFEKVVMNINSNLNTNFKLCQEVTQLIMDIKNKDYSSGYYINNLYYLYDIKNKDNKIDYNTFDDYKHLCYSVGSDSGYGYRETCYYIRQIFCNIEEYSIFGLSINSTIEEVQEKMFELNFYESKYEASISVVNYSYKYDYGYIQFIYNPLTKKINSFMIDVEIDPSQYKYY